jgi:hypothetical protein
MNCTVCRLPSAYNRAVVDTVTDETLGCLCTSCIEDFFGRSLATAEATDGTCLLCKRDGFYALPKWRCETESNGHRVDIVALNAAVARATPRLCDRHYTALRNSTGCETASDHDLLSTHGE